jgi:hypothetical protein
MLHIPLLNQSQELAQYVNLFRTMDAFKLVATAGLVMFFQQWTGIDSSKLFMSCLSREHERHPELI